MSLYFKKTGTICALLSFIVCGLPAQTINYFNSGKPAMKKENSAVPFELYGHRILVDVKINDSQENYHFLLDTGALSFIGEKAAQALHIEKGMEIPTMGEINKAYLTESAVHISLGDVKVGDLFLPIYDFSNFQKSGYGPQIDGFIGSDFLRFFKVSIDYKQKILIFSGNSDSVDPPGDVHKIEFENHFPTRAPMVEVEVDRSIKIGGMIDTGSPYLIVCPLSLMEDTNFLKGRNYIKSRGIMAKWPISDIDKNYLIRFKSLKMGSLEILNIPVLFANTGDALVGRDFLAQFIVTINYPAKELILRPHGKPDFKNNLFSTGLALEKTEGNDRTRVKGLWENSPADKSGIQVGDEVLEINSKNAKDLSLFEIMSILEDDSVNPVELSMRNDEGVKKVVLDKEMLFPAVEN